MHSDTLTADTSPARQASFRVAGILGVAWGVPFLALLSGSNVLKGIFFSAHGGLAPMFYIVGNVAAVSTIISRIRSSPSAHRARVAFALLAVAGAYVLLAYPYALALKAYLSPPFTDSISQFYAVLMLPFSWLFMFML